MQKFTVIDSASAPSTYSYPMQVPAGATVAIDPDTGMVTVTGSDGFWIGALTGVGGRREPVQRVMPGMHLNGQSGEPGPRVLLETTTWGRQIQTGQAQGASLWRCVTNPWFCEAARATGQVILNHYGWNEATAKVPALASKPTYNQQFRCHVLGAYTPRSGGAAGDLEGWQTNNPHWLTDGRAFPDKCNWTPIP